MHIFQDHETKVISAFLKAAREGRMEVDCGTASSARALRARGYAVAAKVRSVAEKDPAYRETESQMAEVSLHVEGSRLVFKRKDQDPGMLALVAALGGEGEVEDPNKTRMDESLRKLREKLGDAPGDKHVFEPPQVQPPSPEAPPVSAPPAYPLRHLRREGD